MPKEIKVADESCQSAQTISRVSKKNIIFFNSSSSLTRTENTYLDRQDLDRPNKTLNLIFPTKYLTDVLVKQKHPLNLSTQQIQILQKLFDSTLFNTILRQHNLLEFLTKPILMDLLSHPNPFSFIWILHELKKNNLLTETNVAHFLIASKLPMYATRLYLLGQQTTISQTQIDQLLNIAPSHFTEILQKNTIEFTLLEMKLPAEKFDALGVILVYGFKEARDLTAEKGIAKFTLNQINDALGIDYGTINHTLITSIAQGIVIDKTKIDFFSQAANLDKCTAEKLLISYAHFLRDHYDYLSVSACLKRKAQKYLESFFIYTLIKNNHSHSARTSPEYPNNFFKLFLAFLYGGDQQGYSQKEAFFCDQDKTEDQGCVAKALDNLMFRRLSKLGLIWSAHAHLPVNFYRTFTPEDAKNKTSVESYEPITFSEYRLLSRHRTFFTHIKEIDRTSAQDQDVTLTPSV